MFRKLLKYDLNAVFRIWWVLALGTAGISVFGAVILRMMIQYGDAFFDRFTLLALVGIFGEMAVLFAVVAFVVFTYVLIYVRFYQNFYSDEGYLTFTLPISRRTLFRSKTLSALIIVAATTGVLLLCVLIYLFALTITKEGLFAHPVWEGIAWFFRSAWEVVGGGWMMLYILEFLLGCLLMQLFQIELIEFCITLGAIWAKKHKVLAAIGIYYLVNSVLSVVLQIITSFGMVGLADGFFMAIANLHGGQLNGLLALVTLLVLVIMATGTLFLHYLTLDKIERRLNLA